MPSDSAATSPSEDSTRRKPAARAAWAVAAPTANTFRWRSLDSSAKARTPLAEVKARATTPSSSTRASSIRRTASRGRTRGV